MTQAKKHDEHLLKNHHKCPVGSVPPPEVHNVQKNTRNKFNGSFPKNKTDKRKHNIRQMPNSNKRKRDNAKSKNDNKCYRCGEFSYFAKNCRAPKHLVALYQKSLKKRSSQQETQDMRHTSILYLRLSRK